MSELKNRLADLASQSYAKNIYTFSDFLSEESLAETLVGKFSAKFETFGGCDFATRKMVRFGDDCYGSESYPITVLHAMPKSKKFGEQISHRDVLGSVMNLGIAREKIGDIFCEGANSYIICEEKIGNYILENLERIGRNSVCVEFTECVPDSCKPKTQSVKLSVASPRLDAVIAKLYNMSRESVLELFQTSKVRVDSKPCENNSKSLTGGEVVSVRGYGKFKYIGEAGVSRKGKTYVEVEQFI